ncbi:MAG: TetR/AcrR family transcriptional regulator, partial [Parvularculaceae bacterium]
LRVFARDGISRSKIGDIAAEAGMSTSTLYEYFPSKEDIAQVVPISHWAQFYEEYADAARKLQTCHERLYTFLWLNADFARRNDEWARVFYLEIWPSVAIADSELRANIDDFARVVIALLKEGKATGEFKKFENPYEASAILIGSVSQIITTWLLYRRPKNLSKAAESMLANIIGRIL